MEDIVVTHHSKQRLKERANWILRAYSAEDFLKDAVRNGRVVKRKPYFKEKDTYVCDIKYEGVYVTVIEKGIKKIVVTTKGPEELVRWWKNEIHKLYA